MGHDYYCYYSLNIINLKVLPLYYFFGTILPLYLIIKTSEKFITKYKLISYKLPNVCIILSNIIQINSNYSGLYYFLEIFIVLFIREKEKIIQSTFS